MFGGTVFVHFPRHTGWAGWGPRKFLEQKGWFGGAPSGNSRCDAVPANPHGVTGLTERIRRAAMLVQANGVYQVKNERLKELHQKLMDLRGRFDDFAIRHIPRFAR